MADTFANSPSSTGAPVTVHSRAPELLLVTSSFFPQATDSTHRLLEFCEQLSKLGIHVTVLTEAKHKSWPAEIMLDRTRVVRVPLERSGGILRRSHGNELRHWLNTNSHRFQAVYFDSPWHRTHEYLLKDSHPEKTWTWMRFDVNQQVEESSESTTAARVSPADQIALQKVSEVLVPNAASQQALAAISITEINSQRIVDRSVALIDRSIGARRNARLLLSETSQDLFLRQKDQFILIPGEFRPAWQIHFALRALGPLLQANSQLRLWILGEGRERKRVYRYLKDQSVHYAVSLPGVFTDVTELLQAVDLCLFPGENAGLSWWANVCAKSRIPM
ncbi:MAG: glycosyltransferase, partial [Planctomycetota bacterium]